MGKNGNGIDHQAGHGNGADDDADFDNDDVLSPEELEELDEELAAAERIVAYEQLCSMIVQALSHRSLKLYHFQNLLNMNTLDREFKVIIGLNNLTFLDRLGGASAELSLTWEAANSLLSLYGDEGLCSPYHDAEEWCSHQDVGPSPEVEVALRYRVPEAAIDSIRDDDDVNRVAEQLRTLFGSDGAEDDVEVNFEAIYTRGELKLISAMIQYDILLQDELKDVELLQNILNDLAREVFTNLKKMVSAFPSEKN